jgi:hypothetical protein
MKITTNKQLFFMLIMGFLFSIVACKKEVENTIPVNNPTITSVAPNEGTVGTELAIIGTGFTEGASVLVGTITSAKVEITTDTVYALVPAGIPANTPLSVTVRNADGGEVTIQSAFTAVSPVLSFVNSATKPSGSIGSTVILEGKAFGDLQGEGQVLFSDGTGGTITATIANPEDWTNTFIITTVPQGAADGPVVIKTAIGSSNSLPFTIASSAAFSPSAISWKLATSLPVAVSGHSAVSASIDDASNTTHQFVYVTGGRNSSSEAVNQVLVGEIGNDGNISTWSATTSLPEARSFHAQITATPFNSKVKGSGYLYVIGGTDASGAPVSTISLAPLNNDGTVSGWHTTTPLPQPLHSLGAVIFRGSIYIAGGATTGNAPVAKVYKANIDTLGQLSAWQELASLPSARAYHGFVSFGGVLYTVGGETGAVEPDNGNYQSNDTKLAQIDYAKINIRTGNLTEQGWATNANSMQKARSKHTAVVAGGNIFVSSGLYSGAGNGSSENIYAQINADGTVESFAGATGSNTIKSAGGNNLFNLAGVSYIDANGVAHVMVIGGDDLNKVGDKQAEAIYY